jgi:hypothetical protein
MPGASQNTSAAILSSVAFDQHALNFATAGVSKRISVYNYAEAITTYATGQTGEVRPKSSSFPNSHLQYPSVHARFVVARCWDSHPFMCAMSGSA